MCAGRKPIAKNQPPVTDQAVAIGDKSQALGWERGILGVSGRGTELLHGAEGDDIAIPREIDAHTGWAVAASIFAQHDRFAAGVNRQSDAVGRKRKGATIGIKVIARYDPPCSSEALHYS